METRARSFIERSRDAMKVAYWMFQQGCKCKDLRVLTIGIVASGKGVMGTGIDLPSGVSVPDAVAFLLTKLYSGKATSGAQWTSATIEKVAQIRLQSIVNMSCCLSVKDDPSRYIEYEGLKSWDQVYRVPPYYMDDFKPENIKVVVVRTAQDD